MNTFTRSTLAILVACTCTAAAAQAISKDTYKANVKVIEADYKAAKTACDSFRANAKDICIAEAKGREKTAIAEAELAYEPGPKARYNVSIAKAEATYAVARERCDDSAGNTKDVCVKTAKSAETAAKADANTVLKTVQANKSANETSDKAHMEADKKVSAAKQDASVDKRDAEYAVAIEKCDSLASDAKDNCVAAAKKRFGKS
jgi:hypothetical protein